VDLRLSYRIASMAPVLPHPTTLECPVGPAVLKERIGQEAEMIARVPHFNFDNVADFYAAHDRQLWHQGEDIPNWAPPFGAFFAEWNEPRAWNVGGAPLPPDGRDGQVGFLVIALQVTDQTRGDVARWKEVLARMAGASALPGQDERLASCLPEARWVLFCSPWSSLNVRPVCGAPVWLGYCGFVFVSAEGRWLTSFATGLTLRFVASQAGEEGIWSPFHILGLGISFCHCKNVRRVEAEADAGERWHRRTHVPRVKFYTLEINPMREVLRREGRCDEVGIGRALHICRGHFATYSPEHPLFGKYVGTFWRPDHVRGSAGAGEVHKRYQVGGTHADS
jgi:hypothetical protein